MIAPLDILYSENHLWVKEVEGSLLLGLTDYAQDSMGDLQYIDLPAVNTQLNKGCCFGGAETSKSVNELIAPLDAVVAEVNEKVIDTPEIVNGSPYEDGWLLRVTSYATEDLETLMNSVAYKQATA